MLSLFIFPGRNMLTIRRSSRIPVSQNRLFFLPCTPRRTFVFQQLCQCRTPHGYCIPWQEAFLKVSGNVQLVYVSGTGARWRNGWCLISRFLISLILNSLLLAVVSFSHLSQFPHFSHLPHLSHYYGFFKKGSVAVHTAGKLQKNTTWWQPGIMESCALRIALAHCTIYSVEL